MKKKGIWCVYKNWGLLEGGTCAGCRQEKERVNRGRRMQANPLQSFTAGFRRISVQLTGWGLPLKPSPVTILPETTYFTKTSEVQEAF